MGSTRENKRTLLHLAAIRFKGVCIINASREAARVYLQRPGAKCIVPYVRFVTNDAFSSQDILVEGDSEASVSDLGYASFVNIAKVGVCNWRK
jgi:hypothetical protein